MEPKSSFWKTLIRGRRIRSFDKVEGVYNSFSITEKTLFLVAAVVFAAGALTLLGKVSDSFSVGIPKHGGSLTEGIIGTPRFINPLLAVSDADRDLSALVYSGLLKSSPDGKLSPDLAESYTVSPDGLMYTVVLRPEAKFHDGTPVTSDDVEFTVTRAQDATLKSPRRVNWEGVTVTKKDPHTVVFSLKQPYAPFITNLTMGILPAHLWKNLTSDQFPFSTENLKPVGSGPYVIGDMKRSSDGIPTEVSLKANSRYVLGEPYISTLTFKFFTNEKALISALKNGSVESASNISPSAAKSLGSDERLLTTPLTRVFGVFFNQNENEILAHKEVRKALSLVIDKNDIIGSVLQGFGTEADGPLPPTVEQKALADRSPATTTAEEASTTLAAARSLLTKAGWKLNPAGIFELKGKTKGTASTTLSVSLSTANIPELVESAKKIEDDWTTLGVKVDVRVFEPSDLNQGVIRPRKYDALLFGLVTGKNSDLYPFWHSSQRNDPGLNVALYTNQKADKLLEKMRLATSSSAIASEYTDFKKELDTDTPAIFIWSPDYIYAVPDKLKGVKLGEITTPSDRFLGAEGWYVNTEHVWNIFVKDKNTIIDENEN